MTGNKSYFSAHSENNLCSFQSRDENIWNVNLEMNGHNEGYRCEGNETIPAHKSRFWREICGTPGGLKSSRPLPWTKIRQPDVVKSSSLWKAKYFECVPWLEWQGVYPQLQGNLCVTPTHLMTSIWKENSSLYFPWLQQKDVAWVRVVDLNLLLGY